MLSVLFIFLQTVSPSVFADDLKRCVESLREIEEGSDRHLEKQRSRAAEGADKARFDLRRQDPAYLQRFVSEVFLEGSSKPLNEMQKNLVVQSIERNGAEDFLKAYEEASFGLQIAIRELAVRNASQENVDGLDQIISALLNGSESLGRDDQTRRLSNTPEVARVVERAIEAFKASPEKVMAHIVRGEISETTEEFGRKIQGGLHTPSGFREILGEGDTSISQDDLGRVFSSLEQLERAGAVVRRIQKTENDVIQVTFSREAFNSGAWGATRNSAKHSQSTIGGKSFFPDSYTPQMIHNAILSILSNEESVIKNIKLNEDGQVQTAIIEGVYKPEGFPSVRISVAINNYQNLPKVGTAYPSWFQNDPQNLREFLEAWGESWFELNEQLQARQDILEDGSWTPERAVTTYMAFTGKEKGGLLNPQNENIFEPSLSRRVMNSRLALSTRPLYEGLASDLARDPNILTERRLADLMKILAMPIDHEILAFAHYDGALDAIQPDRVQRASFDFQTQLAGGISAALREFSVGAHLQSREAFEELESAARLQHSMSLRRISASEFARFSESKLANALIEEMLVDKFGSPLKKIDPQSASERAEKLGGESEILRQLQAIEVLQPGAGKNLLRDLYRDNPQAYIEQIRRLSTQ